MSRYILLLVLAVAILSSLENGMAAQRPPTIAAAANLNFALTEIADRFARDRGTPVDVVFGASGTLTRQIRDGAPFELLLAADEEFVHHLGLDHSSSKDQDCCAVPVTLRSQADMVSRGVRGVRTLATTKAARLATRPP